MNRIIKKPNKDLQAVQVRNYIQNKSDPSYEDDDSNDEFEVPTIQERVNYSKHPSFTNNQRKFVKVI
jgi:hypothetical protein